MSAHLAKSLLATLLCLPALSFATTFNRCEDSDGNITFTSLSCPAGNERKLHNAYNAPPGSATLMLPPSENRERYTGAAAGRPAREEEVLVIGERDDGCGNRLSPEQRRRAMMNRLTPPGMTRQDVENMLGKPDTIANRNGELQYTYKRKEGRSNSVAFDQDGCVKGKK